MTTKQAKIVDALWNMDSTGLLVQWYKHGSYMPETIAKAMRRYRYGLRREQMHDELKRVCINCIMDTCAHHGRATMHRSRFADVRPSAAMNDYFSRKALYLAGFQAGEHFDDHQSIMDYEPYNAYCTLNRSIYA